MWPDSAQRAEDQNEVVRTVTYVKPAKDMADADEATQAAQAAATLQPETEDA